MEDRDYCKKARGFQCFGNGSSSPSKNLVDLAIKYDEISGFADELLDDFRRLFPKGKRLVDFFESVEIIRDGKSVAEALEFSNPSGKVEEAKRLIIRREHNNAAAVRSRKRRMGTISTLEPRGPSNNVRQC